MIICPQCQAENETGAALCHGCGTILPTLAGGGALPSWLQALKPEPVLAGGAAKPLAGGTAKLGTGDLLPAPLPSVVAASAPAASGTDTLMATQPTPAARATANSPAKSGGQASETASLISEDDLPAWLRAFSEPDTATVATSADDQSWMLGTNAATVADAVGDNLAQSWQVSARPTAPRAAAAAFAAPVANPAKVTKAARPEPIGPATVAVATAKEQAVPGALPTRLGTSRALPAGGRGGTAAQRMATIAFIVALVIFLIVLGIFVVVPALRG